MKLEVDALLNHDRTYKIRAFPAFLNNASFIQVPHKSIAQGSVITIITSGATTVYVGFEYPGDSGGFEHSLQNSGWSKEEGQILTTARTMKEIHSMNMNGATSISLPPTTTGKTVMLIMAKCPSKG